MLSALSIANAAGTDVSLLNSSRLVTATQGLAGLPAARASVRPRPDRHGAINETSYLSEDVIAISMILKGANPSAVWSEYDSLTEVLWEAVGNDRLLKWTRAPADAREGLTNLVTNPSFEVDTAGWTTFGTNTVARDSARAKFGGFSLKCTYNDDLRLTALTLLGLEANTRYSVSAWVYLPSANWPAVAAVNIGHDGSYAGATVDPTGDNTTVKDQWVRITTAITTSTDGDGGIFIRTLSTPAAGNFIYLDGVQVVKASSGHPDYFDGDTKYGTWTGTRHASTSKYSQGLQQTVRYHDVFDAPLQPEHAGVMMPVQIQFLAEDPRAYTQTTSSPQGDLLSSAAGGLTFPAAFNGPNPGGWKFTPSGGGTLSFTNTGKVPSPITLRIRGQCSSPQILLVDTGERIVFTGSIAAGDYLDVDLADRSILLNGVTSRRNLLDSEATDWPEGAPKGTSTFRLLAASFDSAARLEVVNGRGAYA